MASTLQVDGAITGSSTIQGTTITATTAFVPDASDGAALGTTSLEFSDLYLADGAVIALGDDQDVTLTHVVDTGILLSSTDQLQFGDSGTYIHQSADGVLDLVSDTEIEINATTIDVNGALDVSGTSTLTGNVTMSADASVGDDLTLVSDGAILNFGANSDVSLTHVHNTGLLLNSTMALQFNDSSQYINAPSATVLDINATDEIELNATAVDLNGTLDVSGTLAVTSVSTLGARIDHYTGGTGGTLAAQYGSGDDIGLTGSVATTDFNIKCVGEFAVGTAASGTTVFRLEGTAASLAGALAVTGDVTAAAASFTDDVTISGDITISDDVIVGTNPSSYGEIRLNKNFAIATRNNANDANKMIVSENTVTGNDTLDFGDNAKWSALRFHAGASNVLELTATAINLNKIVTMVSAVTMSNASINMTGLPTSDPGVAGRLWNDSNTVKVSAG